MTKVIAFDTETRGFRWFDPTEHAFLASWADAGGEYVADLSDPDQVSHVLSVLSDADVLVCHNAKFDLHQMRETLGWNGLDCALVEDTDLMSRVMYPSGAKGTDGGFGGHGLKTLATAYIDPNAEEPEKAIEQMANQLGIKLHGENATKGAYYDIWRAYPEPMETYAKSDARYTYDLYVKFTAEMTETQGRVYELERQVLPVLYRAEERGIALDQAPVLALKKQYESQLHEMQDVLSKELGDEALGGKGSEAALIEALQKQGIPLHETTDTGQLSTAHRTLAEFEDDFECIQHLFSYRRAKKFLSTYIDPMVGREVVHTSFNQYQAWTGRMSARSPNMQNVPKHAGKTMGSMFIPRPGYCFIDSDYEGIESRLLAYYLGNQRYRDLFNDGHDPHAWMASQIYGGPMENYFKGTAGAADRQNAKEVTYAICYGAGGPRITSILGLDPGPYWGPDHPAIVDARARGKDWPRVGNQYHAARSLIKKVKATLPGFARLNNRIKRKIEDVGYVNTLWGRQNMVQKDKAYVGMSALIQGGGADIMKQGLVNVDAAVRGLGAIPLLVVHDSVLTECPIEYAEECQVLQDEALCAAYNLNPVLATSSTIKYNHYAEED